MSKFARKPPDLMRTSEEPKGGKQTFYDGNLCIVSPRIKLRSHDCAVSEIVSVLLKRADQINLCGPFS